MLMPTYKKNWHNWGKL